MRARADEVHMQGVWRGEHMRARADEVHMQGVRWGGKMHAWTDQENMQGVCQKPDLRLSFSTEREPTFAWSRSEDRS